MSILAPSMKVLLVEDDEFFVRLLKQVLSRQNYIVDIARDGLEAMELATNINYDVIVSDLMLPHLDGLQMCRRLRDCGLRTPILLLTALDSSSERIMGLDSGADDYMCKPVNLDELCARVRALVRRSGTNLSPILKWGALRLNPVNCEVMYNQQPLSLTSKEYMLLELFMRNNRRIFSQGALVEHLWAGEDFPSENTVRSHIRSLRQKLKQVGAGNIIETVHRLGYRLHNEEPSSKVDSLPPEPVRANPTAVRSLHKESDGHDTMNEPDWDLSHLQQYLQEKVAVLREAIEQLKAGSLSETLYHQTERQAHTLVGSLGCLHLQEGAQVARDFETLWRSSSAVSQIEHLEGLLVALEQTIAQPLMQPSSATRALRHPTPLKQPCRLLIVEDDLILGERLTVEAAAWGIQTEWATTIAMARLALDRSPPDIVLLDLQFPDSMENGFILLEELNTKQSQLPVVVFTVRENFADRVKVARLGGRGFLQKPVTPFEVMETISEVLQRNQTPVAPLLIVDDDPMFLDQIRVILEPWGFYLNLLDDPQAFWQTLEHSQPALVLMDEDMPNISGLDLCRVVRNDNRWRDLPILLMSNDNTLEAIHRRFHAGADDYIHKPIVEPELLGRILNRI